MKQMTIRNFDPDLEKRILSLSESKKWSINQTAVYLMRKGLGLTDQIEPRLIGNQLQSFFGHWSEKDSRAFDAEISAAFGKIDEENWK